MGFAKPAAAEMVRPSGNPNPPEDRSMQFARAAITVIAVIDVLPIVACAARPKPPTQYVRAAPVAEAPKPPAVVQVPRLMPLPGQLKRIPVPRVQIAKGADRSAPWNVIDDANRKAAAGPDADGYFNAIMTYDYAPGALYQVYTAPLRLTGIQLQPGEKILGKPAAGDTIRWVMGIGHSGSGADDQQHLYIKPTRPGLHTTVAINTDRRTYYLELQSFEDTYMAAVQWRYPHDEVDQLEAAAAHDEALAKATTATSAERR